MVFQGGFQNNTTLGLDFWRGNSVKSILGLSIQGGRKVWPRRRMVWPSCLTVRPCARTISPLTAILRLFRHSRCQISLQTRIHDIIASLSPEAGVFVKLTTRSPKDSAVAIAKARNAFLTRLLSLGERPSANDRLVLLAEVMTHSLRVRTGEEAIHLLMFSARVEEDLEYALNLDYNDFEKCMCLVVRKWVDIHQWAEFRCFVWEGPADLRWPVKPSTLFPSAGRAQREDQDRPREVLCHREGSYSTGALHSGLCLD